MPGWCFGPAPPFLSRYPLLTPAPRHLHHESTSTTFTTCISVEACMDGFPDSCSHDWTTVANKQHKAHEHEAGPAVPKQPRNPAVRSSRNGRNTRLEIPRTVTKGLSELVARQGELVDKQEKRSKAVESRARKVIARAKAARKEADSAELSAVEMLRDLPQR